MPDPETLRRQSNKDRVLAYLQVRGSATNIELTAIGGMRFGGRVFELRKEGYLIDTERVKDGVFRFVFRGRRPLGQLPLEAVAIERY